LIEIAFLLPGNKARDSRRVGADKVRRVLGGDVTLLDEIERRHAEMVGTEQEAFLPGQNTSQAVVAAAEPTPMQLYLLDVERVKTERIKVEADARLIDAEIPVTKVKFAHDWRQSLEQIGAFTVTDLMSYQQILRPAELTSMVYLQGVNHGRDEHKEVAGGLPEDARREIDFRCYYMLHLAAGSDREPRRVRQHRDC
jgi:hypothetical protein